MGPDIKPPSVLDNYGGAEWRQPDRFLAIDRTLARGVGLSNAIFMANIVEKFYFPGHRYAGDGVFYYTLAEQQADTLLTINTLRRAKRFFIQEGVLVTWLQGIPAKEHYRLDLPALEALIRRTSPPPDNVTPLRRPEGAPMRRTKPPEQE